MTPKLVLVRTTTSCGEAADSSLPSSRWHSVDAKT